MVILIVLLSHSNHRTVVLALVEIENLYHTCNDSIVVCKASSTQCVCDFIGVGTCAYEESRR